MRWHCLRVLRSRTTAPRFLSRFKASCNSELGDKQNAGAYITYRRGNLFRQPAMRSLQDQKVRTAPDLSETSKISAVRGTQRASWIDFPGVGRPRRRESMLPFDHTGEDGPEVSG